MLVHNGDLLRSRFGGGQVVVILSTEIRAFPKTRMGLWSWQLCSENADG